MIYPKVGTKLYIESGLFTAESNFNWITYNGSNKIIPGTDDPNLQGNNSALRSRRSISVTVPETDGSFNVVSYNCSKNNRKLCNATGGFVNSILSTYDGPPVINFCKYNDYTTNIETLTLYNFKTTPNGSKVSSERVTYNTAYYVIPGKTKFVMQESDGSHYWYTNFGVNGLGASSSRTMLFNSNYTGDNIIRYAIGSDGSDPSGKQHCNCIHAFGGNLTSGMVNIS